MGRTVAAPLWRYSIRWALPHLPCPGLVELASAEVTPGQPCPSELLSIWSPGTGYAVSLDFQQSAVVRRWSQEAKSRTRFRRLEQRLQRQAPLFAAELFERETAQRREYFLAIDHTGGN